MTELQSIDRVHPRLLRHPIHFLAFGFGAGLSPWAPGTAGTLVAVPIVWGIAQFGTLALAMFCIAAALLGIFICGDSAKRLGVHDHQGIVWDEITGFAITMIAVPMDGMSLFLGFVLFRWMDIWKPWPIREADHRLMGGVGIMLDDVLAGVFAAALLFALRSYVFS